MEISQESHKKINFFIRYNHQNFSNWNFNIYLKLYILINKYFALYKYNYL